MSQLREQDGIYYQEAEVVILAIKEYSKIAEYTFA